MRIGFIGAGRAATVLATGLAEHGYRVVAVSSRRQTSAAALAARLVDCTAHDAPQAVVEQADVTFLTVPDDAVGRLAAELAWTADKAAVHCSGALGVEVLAAEAARAQAGGLHPMQTLADGASPDVLRGSTFAVEGPEPLASTLEQMARALGGRPLRLPPGARALYHTSGTLVSNYVVTLVRRAVDLWETFGVDRNQALQALLPLLGGTVGNLERAGLPNALTGPIARGDTGTLRRHLEALEAGAPQLLPLYCQLGLETLPLAAARGAVAPEQVREMKQIFESRVESRESRAAQLQALDSRPGDRRCG